MRSTMRNQTLQNLLLLSASKVSVEYLIISRDITLEGDGKFQIVQIVYTLIHRCYISPSPPSAVLAGDEASGEILRLSGELLNGGHSK